MMSLPLMFAPCHLYKSVYRVLMKGRRRRVDVELVGYSWTEWETVVNG